jgi:hypothetical protein
MILLRLALVTCSKIPARWRSICVNFGEARVEPLGSAVRNDASSESLIPSAAIHLKYKPEINRERLIVIPSRQRRLLEYAIENYATLLSICEHLKRRVSSPSPIVALMPENKFDRQLLAGAKGFVGSAQNNAIRGARNAMDVECVLQALTDRLDGVALLAEAIANDLPSSQFREFIKLFERGFGEGGHKLIRPLSAYLQSNTLRYVEEEVKNWLKIRDGLTHADKRKRFLLGSDVAWIVNRIKQAAYDVLLNKKNWNEGDYEPRTLWRPVAGIK